MFLYSLLFCLAFLIPTRIRLDTITTSRDAAGSIPDGVTVIFH
jgi:hypothetical protein